MNEHDIEWICRLSPQQKGMLFEALAGGDSGIHLDHLLCTLEGQLSVPAFEAAWSAVFATHAILRTGYVWERQDEPYQVVFREVEPILEVHDLRGCGRGEIELRLGELLAQERQRGFDLHRPPLLRSTLVRVAEDTHRWLWSSHHILMDGWCRTLLLGDLLRHYDDAVEGRQPRIEPARPYCDFVAWLESQGHADSEAFWRRTLSGVTSPSPLGRVVDVPDVPADDSDRYDALEGRLDGASADALRTLARRERVTLTTLLEAAWGVLLSRLAGSDDVTFGVTVSGRPPHLEGMQTMVGLFINTLPMRLRVRPDARFADWLDDVRERQLAIEEHQHCSEGEIHGWSEIPGWQPLFESVLVVENYPLDRTSFGSRHIDVGFRDARYQGAFTKYAATLLASVRNGIGFRLVLDRRRISKESGRRLLDGYVRILATVADNPSLTIDSLRTGIPDTAIPRFRPRRRPATSAGHADRPRDEIEEALTEIWREVLGFDGVGIHDSFFDLGGHSLLAAELTRRMGSRFRVSFPLRTLFENPTIADLGMAVAQAKAAQVAPEDLDRMLDRLEAMPADGPELRDTGEARS